jgi:hypothetical protein
MSQTPDRNPENPEEDPQAGGDPRQQGPQPQLGHTPRRSRAPWITAGVAVLVVVVIVILVVSLSGHNDDDNDPDGPTGVANAVVDALNAKDADAMSTLMCQPRIPVLLETIQAQSDKVETRATLKGFATVGNDTATAIITIRTTYQGKDVDQDVELSMNKQRSTWCADIFSGPANLFGG